MATLVTADVHGQTQHGYDAIISALTEPLKKAPGFILHTSHAVEGGWRVLEVWQTKADSDRFYAQYVAPNIPPGVRPKRSYQELHSLVTAFTSNLEAA